MGPSAWRYMFLIGVLPALLTLWVRRAIPESERWERVNDQRQAAIERKRSGASLGAQEEALARFTVADLFAEPEIRRRIILAFLMSLATTFAFWGISTWIPPYIGAVAAKAGLSNQAMGRAMPAWRSTARRSSAMSGSASSPTPSAASR